MSFDAFSHEDAANGLRALQHENAELRAEVTDLRQAIRGHEHTKEQMRLAMVALIDAAEQAEPQPCPSCDGSGYASERDGGGDLGECSTCRGVGVVEQTGQQLEKEKK